ncbi:c-type cytochrome [Maribellus maritimus]|uniref:c-type cytochrome n=1 Tax=Maribellus maritimus TaxID=2870838 RepID=UPI001EE9B8BD|nr:cytochrome c [Maribellus maritimus]MCG6186582.1 cytochrome c [Maribellus maritimus]
MKTKVNRLMIGILMFLALPGMGQDWQVPADQLNIENPSSYNLENVKKGKDLYLQNCKSCHGDPGKNNHLPLVPPPPDITSEQMQANTDGGLFYKITKGRGGMPQFETTISADDRWRLINFIRNYNSEKEQLLIDAPPVNAKILASVNEAEKKVEILAEYEDKSGSYQQLENAPVFISAKKAFGNLLLGQALTDKNGRSVFSVPETVIGDEEGNVTIVVTLDENYKAEQVVLEEAKVGKPKEVPQLIRKEVLWSTNENVQIWLLLSYLGAAGAAWIAIGYVIFQLIKIKRFSKQ